MMPCSLNKNLIITVTELQMSSNLTLYPGHPYLIPKPKQLTNHAYNISVLPNLSVSSRYDKTISMWKFNLIPGNIFVRKTLFQMKFKDSRICIDYLDNFSNKICTTNMNST